MTRWQAARTQLEEFFFPALSDTWLAVLRIGVGLQIGFYCLSLRNDWHNLFARDGGGLIDRDLAEAILNVSSPLIPRLGWLMAIAQPLGLTDANVLDTVWICLFGASCCLVVGFLCRTAAVAAWFLYLCTIKSGNLVLYGVDNFTTIGLFYLMLSPLPDRFALDARLWPGRGTDAHIRGFFLRVLQLHLCAIYFFGGLNKVVGVGWWNGDSLWRALTRPPFNTIPTDLLAAWSVALPVLGMAVCILETGYPFFIWFKRTRVVWLTGILLMHIGIAAAMSLYLFSSMMIVLNLAAFGCDLFRRQVGKSLSVAPDLA